MALPPIVREHPYWSVGAGLLTGTFLLYQWGVFATEKPAVQAHQRPERVVASTMTPKRTLQGQVDGLEKVLTEQKDAQTATLKALQQVQRQLQETTEAQEKKDARFAETLTQQNQKAQAEIDRLKKERVGHATPKPAPPRPPAVTKAPPHASAPAPVFELRTIGSSKDTKRRTIPPVAHQEDMAYLGEASMAPARIVTGVVASGRGAPNAPGSEGDTPALLSITGPFDSAWMLHSPDRNPQPTYLPIQGCRMFGWSRADLASGRVYIHLYLMVCVMPDKTTYPVKIRGYVTDKDGTAGVVGRLETRDSAMVAKATLTALMQEMIALVGLAKSAVVVTSNAGSYQQMGTGVQSGIQQVTQHFLEQARLLGPQLWVESGLDVNVVMLEGITLEGFPVVAMLGDR